MQLEFQQTFFVVILWTPVVEDVCEHNFVNFDPQFERDLLEFLTVFDIH